MSSTNQSIMIANKLIEILNESYSLIINRKNEETYPTLSDNSNLTMEMINMNELLIINELNLILQQSFYIKFLSIIHSKEVSLFILNYLNIREKPIMINRINNENLLTIDKLIFHIYHRIVLSDENKDIMKAINSFLQSDNYNALGVKRILNIVNDINKVYYESNDIHNYIITSISFTNVSTVVNMISIVGDSNKNVSSKIVIKLLSVKSKNEFEDVIIDMNIALEKILENNLQLHSVNTNNTNSTNTNTNKKPFKAISISNIRIKTKRTFPLLKKAEELFKDELKRKNEKSKLGSKFAQQSLALLECLADICYSLSMLFDASFVLLSKSTLFVDNGDKLSIISINMLSNLQQIYEIFLVTIEQYYNDKDFGEYIEKLSLLCKKRTIQCVSILMRSTIHYLLNDNVINTNKSNTDGATWIDEFQRQLDSQNNGILLSDTTRFYKQTVWQLLSLLTNDEVQTQYMLNALSTPNGVLNRNLVKNDIIVNKNVIGNTSKDIQQSNYHETLATLKDFFPDYGKGFLLAVLSTYDFDVESTVEVIFTDNLPPKLAAMDRKTELIKKGKDDNMSKVSSGGLGLFGLPEDEEFKRLQIERVRKMEQEREYDFMLLEQEYADDYDDQYDHPEGALNINDGSSNISKKKSANEQIKIDWDKKMSDMKRLNKITKDEEEEDKFWESMKNDNRTVRFLQPKSHDDDEIIDANETVEKGASSQLKSNLRVTAPSFQPGNNNNGTKNDIKNNALPSSKSFNSTQKKDTDGITNTTTNTTAIGPGRRKITDYRSKVFDRHRQKQKSTRKAAF